MKMGEKHKHLSSSWWQIYWRWYETLSWLSPLAPAAASWGSVWPSWPPTPGRALRRRSWRSARRWPAADASRRLWPAAARCRPSGTYRASWGTCSVWRTTTAPGPATSCGEEEEFMFMRSLFLLQHVWQMFSNGNILARLCIILLKFSHIWYL